MYLNRIKLIHKLQVAERGLKGYASLLESANDDVAHLKAKLEKIREYAKELKDLVASDLPFKNCSTGIGTQLLAILEEK